MQFLKKWSKYGERVIRLLFQTNSILLFGPRITVQNFVKIESKLRPWKCLQTDWHTDASDFIICPMLRYSNGTDNNNVIFSVATAVWTDLWHVTVRSVVVPACLCKNCWATLQAFALIIWTGFIHAMILLTLSDSYFMRQLEFYVETIWCSQGLPFEAIDWWIA